MCIAVALLLLLLPPAPVKSTFLKKYTYARREGRVWVVREPCRYGLVDSRGRVLAQPIYSDIGPFSEGRAEVVLPGAPFSNGQDVAFLGRHGFIDQQGRLVVPCRYASVQAFRNGQAQVVTIEGDIGYIDTLGRAVAPFSTLGRPYFDGLMKTYYFFQDAQPARCPQEATCAESIEGYDTDRITNHQTLRSYGLTPVFAGDADARRWGATDSVGHVVLPMLYDDLNETTHAWRGWWRVRRGGRYGFVDAQTGRETLRPRYTDTRLPVGNLLWAQENGRWGAIGRDGRQRVPFRYNFVSLYSEGRAAVHIGKRYGYVDTTGRLVVPARYVRLTHFERGQAAVYDGDRWQHIDLDGNVLPERWPLTYWLLGGAGVLGVLFWLRLSNRSL